MAHDHRQPNANVLEKVKTVTKKPTLYQVILHNDDYTTMNFVIAVLESVFYKQPAEAYRLMMEVHLQGRAVCGVYIHEVAETKVATVGDLAAGNGFPLQASIEEE